MNEQKQITLPPMPVEAINLILEGLGNLPLVRSRAVFDFIASNAEKQLKEHSGEQVPDPPVPGG